MADETTPAIDGYDSAVQNSAARSTLIFPRNSRTEHRPATRRSLLEINRGLEANFAFATRLRSKFGRCVAGVGIFPTPTTSDSLWNVQAKELIERWGSNPDAYSIDGSRDFWEDQRLAAEELGAGDGEYFAALVSIGQSMYVQPLDPFEIESPGDARGKLFEDGVRTDAYLRPTHYAVCELAAPGQYAARQWREVERRHMIHVFRRRRAKQLRGLPPLYSGLNPGRDAMDLSALASASAKLHSLLAVSKRRKPDKAGRGFANRPVRTTNSTGQTTKLEEKFKGGALTVEMDNDEELILHASQRPTMSELEGIRFYCALMALGADLPFSVVWSFAGMSGAPTRVELDDAQGSFGIMQDRVVWKHSHPIYVRRLALAQETGELPRCKDPFWWRADWVGPAKITADMKYTAEAKIKLMRNGALSHPRMYEEQGQDARTEVLKEIEFQAWFNKTCADHNVDPNKIIEPTPGAVTNVSVNPADPEA